MSPIIRRKIIIIKNIILKNEENIRDNKNIRISI